MEFRILGPLEVQREGRLLALGGVKQRMLLAALLLEGNRVVSSERLIDVLWGDDPPETARKALQVHVTNLRKLVGPDRIVTDGPGYRIRVEPGELDLERFQLLMRDGGPAGAGAALALWRGRPLANLPEPAGLAPEVARLEELRLAALEERFEADLAAGRGGELVGDLEALVAEHPLRERPRAQLMLALYRAGRQADALQAYQDARRVLVDELGIDPGRRLRELEGAILRQDPALEAVAPEPERVDATPASRGAFVGRGRELAELEDALEAAAAGRGRVFLLAGEPGIGKSRLADELLAAARARGAVPLVGRCWEAGGAPAYWPWTRLLRAYLDQADVNVLRAELGRGAGDVAQLLPELRDLLPGLEQPASADSEGARFRLFDSTAAFLRNAAARTPLVLVLDDLHAADEPTLLLLRFVARELAGSRVLIVAAYRDVDPTLGEALATTLADLAREPVTRTLRIGGLDRPEVERLIELTTGDVAPRDLAELVYEETEGNPFFVVEIVRLLADEGRLGQAVEPRPAIPQSVKEVIERRLRRLGDDCAGLLGIASVLGRDFDLDLLARVAGLGLERLLELLDEARAARIVSDAPGAPGRLRFAHGLVRDAVYDALPTVQRTQLHHRAGESLEARHASDIDSHAAELAHHFFAALPAGVPEKAFAYTIRAAEMASRLFAYEEAVRLYERALRLADDGGAGRCDLLLALGDAYGRAGDTPASKLAFLEAAELAERIGAAERLARAALGYGGRILWQVFGDDPKLGQLLEAALDAIPPGDSTIRVLLLARLAGGPLRDGRFPPHRRVELSREALETARRTGDPSALAYALAGYITANLSPRFTPEQVERSSELLAVARQAGDKERVLEGHEHRVVALLELGDAAGAKADLEEMSRLADELRQPAQRWCAKVDQAMMQLLEGRFAEAERFSREALELSEGVEGYHAAAAFRLQLYLLRREHGRLAEVEQLMRSAASEFPIYSIWPSVLADVHTKLGQETEARSALHRLGADRFAAVPFDEEWLASMTLLAETASALDDAEGANVLYELLLPWADRVAVSYLEFVTGAVARYLGLVATTCGRFDEAERHFERALELNAQIGARPWLAHTQRDYAAMLRRRAGGEDAERAAALHGDACALYAELGMPVPDEPL